MAVIEFRDVSFETDGRRILSGINFTVESGETLVLLGRSGSGKSTALKLTNGMLFPTGGEVLVEGRSTRAWDAIRLKRSIGYVIQDVGLFPHFTVARNVGLVPSLEGWKQPDIDGRVRQLLERMGMPAAEFGSRYPRQLSGGQRQRAGVARALAAEPRILLFDEPFGALDPATRFELQQQYLDLQRDLKKTSIFVTHDVREALRLANRIVLLAGGKVDTAASPEDFQHAQSAEARAFVACA